MAASAITIGGKEYSVDTLEMRQVGPGMQYLRVRIPDYPLNVYMLATDLNNEHNRIETTIGYNTVGRTERLDNAYHRNRTATSRPIAACNANFWCVTGGGEPYSAFELGSPHGAVVRNDSVYLNSEMNSDNWNGGPQRAGSCAVSADKRLHFGRFLCGGHIYSEKFTTPLDFCTVNRRNLPDAITLWTTAYTRTREFETDWVGFNERGANNADNYYLRLKQGSRWAVNADMTFVVEKIVTGADRQTLGDYDACFTVTGNQKAAMALLAVGDEITINHGWVHTDGGNVSPVISNMVEGNAPVMIHGQYTTRNDDENYNSMVYSRTAYGTNAAGDHLYFIVIDKSRSESMGLSNGCNTRDMLDILVAHYPDVTDVVNMDAGGSAQLMLDGKIVNTTTEGNPRAVACGWQVCAAGEYDSEIASIAFYDWKLSAPVYSSLKPRIVAFNSNGEIVDDDLQGFTLECAPELGTTRGDIFIAGGNELTSQLTARYNGLTAVNNVTTLAAQPSLAIKPTIVIDQREWTVPVTAQLDQQTFNYDPAMLGWSVDDPQVAHIDRGRIKGLKEGKTRIECLIGDFIDSDSVFVEFSDQEWREMPWDGWTSRGAGFKNITIADDGTVTFNYSSNRAPYLQFTTDLRLFSCPDSVILTFTSSLPLQKVQLDTRNTVFTSTNYQDFTGEDEAGFEAGKEYTLAIDLEQLGGKENLLTFPLSMAAIRFTPVKSDYGDHTMTLSLRCHYPFPEGDVNLDRTVNTGDVSAVYGIILGTSAIDSLRADLNGDGTVNTGDVSRLYSIILGQ